jgi:hypothetical protein
MGAKSSSYLQFSPKELDQIHLDRSIIHIIVALAGMFIVVGILVLGLYLPGSTASVNENYAPRGLGWLRLPPVN